MNNIYNYLIARHGEAQLRMNGHEYDVVIDNIRDNGIDCNAEFTGYLRSLTPRVNYSDMWKSYREQDKLRTRATYKSRSYISRKPGLFDEIKNVLFKDPATIVFWADGTKTVVKIQDGDIYDPEKGLAMAIAKKALGNQGNYYEVFKDWLPEEEAVVINYNGKSLVEAFADAKEKINKFAEVIKYD